MGQDWNILYQHYTFLRTYIWIFKRIRHRISSSKKQNSSFKSNISSDLHWLDSKLQKNCVFCVCIFSICILALCLRMKFLINDNAVYYCQKIWRFYTICQLTFLSRTIKTFSSDLLFSHGWRIQSAHWCVFPIYIYIFKNIFG